MSDLEQAKAKVIALIKKGVVSKEQGQKALNVYRNAQAKGQNVTIDLVLNKMGLVAPQAAKGGKGGKSGKKKKGPPKPTKKILTAPDESENKYAQRRRKPSKKPMLIGLISLVVLGIIAFFLFQHAQNKIDQHNQEQAQKKAENAAKNAPAPTPEPSPEPNPEE